MNQRFVAQVREIWRKSVNWILGGAVGVTVLMGFLVLMLRVPAWPAWTGFQGTTLHDALTLIIAPLMIAVVAFLFDRSGKNQEQLLAQDDHEDKALQEYFSSMTELLLNKNLNSIPRNDDARAVAVARTRSVLRRLNANRKRSVLEFLLDADLVKGAAPIISLQGADFDRADLIGTHLQLVNLSGASLVGALFSQAHLEGAFLNGIKAEIANFKGAYLDGVECNAAHLQGSCFDYVCSRGARFEKSHFEGARMVEANVHNARFDSAYLQGVQFKRAHAENACFVGANLDRANFRYADLTGADLQNALNLETADFTQANITNTKFPNGFVWHGRNARTGQ